LASADAHQVRPISSATKGNVSGQQHLPRRDQAPWSPAGPERSRYRRLCGNRTRRWRSCADLDHSAPRSVAIRCGSWISPAVQPRGANQHRHDRGRQRAGRGARSQERGRGRQRDARHPYYGKRGTVKNRACASRGRRSCFLASSSVVEHVASPANCCMPARPSVAALKAALMNRSPSRFLPGSRVPTRRRVSIIERHDRVDQPISSASWSSTGTQTDLFWPFVADRRARVATSRSRHQSCRLWDRLASNRALSAAIVRSNTRAGRGAPMASQRRRDNALGSSRICR